MTENTDVKVEQNVEEEVLTEDSSTTSATITTEDLAKPSAIAVPGGLKETPASKPYDAFSLNVPGLSEKPSAQPYDKAAVSVPGLSERPSSNGTTISASAHNEILQRLKTSFKQTTLVFEALENMTVVPDEVYNESSTEALQEEFTEQAIFESYADGPYFEAVKKAQKEDIKPIARKIRRVLTKFKRGITWYSTKRSKPVVNRLSFLDALLLAAFSEEVKLMAWQLVGILLPARGTTYRAALKALNEEFAEDLGKFELKSVTTNIWLGPQTTKEAEDKDLDKVNAITKVRAHILIVDEKDAKTPSDIKVEVDGKNADIIRKAMGDAKAKIQKESVEMESFEFEFDPDEGENIDGN